MGWRFFALKASVLKRIEELEARLKPLAEELQPADFDLLIESENEFFSRQMTVLPKHQFFHGLMITRLESQ
jgi:hypothetical protein